MGDRRLSKTLGRILWLACLVGAWPRGAGADDAAKPDPGRDPGGGAPSAGTTAGDVLPAAPLPLLMAQAAAQPVAAAPTAPAEEEESPGWGLAPIRTGWNGSVGLGFSAPFGDQAGDNSSYYQATLNGMLDTYIWQPWYIRVSGTAGLSWFSTSTSGSASDSLSLTGSGRVSVFPVSRFPFQAYLQRTDSRVTAEILTANFTTTQMGMLQSYASQDGTLNLQGSWDRSLLEQGRVSDTLDVFQANYRQVIPTPSMTHQLFGNARYNLNSLETGRFSSYDASLLHDVRPRENLTLTSNASLSGSKLRQFSANSYQIGSVGVWNSLEQPLTVTGAARASVFSADGPGAAALPPGGVAGTGGDQTLVNVALGAVYSVNPNVAVNGAANVQYETDQPTSTFEAAGVTYSGNPLEWGGWFLNYGGVANVVNQTGVNDDLFVNAGGNYSAQRLLGEFLGGQTSFNFGQGLFWNVAGGSGDQATAVLSSNGTLSWNRMSGARMAQVNLSLNDSREFGGLENAVQLINLQAYLNEALSPTSSWSGNVTVQSSRQETQRGAGQGFVTSISASAGYTQGRLFNVPRLLFTTTLFASTVDFQRSEGNLDPLTSQYNLTWDNRLLYNIGKTEFETRLQVTNNQEQTQGIIFFRVTRLLN